MKRIELENDNYIIKYENAEELPLRRNSKFQKYLLLKSGVGCTIQDVGNHFQNLHGFIAYDKKEEAKKEAENLHYNFFSILNEIEYNDLAFASLIFSINGEKLNDISEENLNKVIDWLSDHGMTKKLVSEEVDDTKERIVNDLKLYFPKFFPESSDFTYFAKIKQGIDASAQKILQQIENESGEVDQEIIKMLDQISKWFVDIKSAKNFTANDPNNCIVKSETSFEELCALVESKGASNPKDFTLIEFYSRLEYIRKSTETEK